MYVTFFHLNHSNILIYFVSVPFNVGQTTDISKEPLHGQAALRRRRNVFSYENIGELPAHRSNAEEEVSWGYTAFSSALLDCFRRSKYLPGALTILWGLEDQESKEGGGRAWKRFLEQTSFSSIKSTGRKLGLWIKLQNGAFSNVSDLCDMFDFSAVTLGSAAEVAKCDWLHARR